MRIGSNLRYASHNLHYALGSTIGMSDDDDDVGESSSFLKGIPLTKASTVEKAVVEEVASNDATSITGTEGGNHTHHVNVSKQASNKKLKRKGGKRARMLRFLDRRFARLQLKSTSNTQQSPSSSSSDSLDLDDDESRLKYEERKAAWAAKYTSVSTLRESFGQNKNRIWGDFDPTTTRKLYHTLLPRALLELKGLRDGLLNSNTEEEEVDKKKQNKIQQLIRPQKETVEQQTNNNPHSDEYYLQQELLSLAPLAYQARLAAKKYARERSRLPGRIGSMLYDGYRSWRRYGKWSSGGMTWEQVWNKYEDQVLREAMEELERDVVVSVGDEEEDEEEMSNAALLLKWKGEDGVGAGAGLMNDEELTARICLRILERSVVTNDAIDRLFLKRLDEAVIDDEDHAVVAEESTTTTLTEDNVVEDSHIKRRRRQERIRRRKLLIQADLQAIEKKFDDDIQELLQYSNLTTSQGDERRSTRRKRDRAFFWKKEQQQDDGIDMTNVVVGNNITVEGAYDAAAQGMKKGPVEATVTTASDGGEDDITIATTAASSSSATATKKSASSALESSEEPVAAMSAIGDDKDDLKRDQPLRRLSVHEVFALRILASTKQRISSLQALSQLGGGGSSDDTEGATKEDSVEDN